MFLTGGNFSQFTTANCEGRIGINLGYYRQLYIWKQLSLNYGFMYSKRRIDLLNKKIRLSDGYSYSEKADIYLDYNIFELNILANYSFLLNKNISIGPVVGVGYAFFPASNSEIDAGENLMQDIGPVVGVGYAFFPASNSEIDAGENLMQDEPVEDYDYRCGFTDGPPIITNSGQIYHLGTYILIGKYFGMLTYTSYMKILSSAGVSDIILDEKLHSVNMLIGIYF